MNRLRVGMLGTGGIATRHATALASLPEQMQLVACCGREPQKVEPFAAKFGAHGYVEFERMLNEQKLDLLIVALPPYAHSGQVEKAAAAGIHLLVENPIALTLDRALSMVTAARDSGVVAACGFMYRFGDAVTRWDTEAAAGATGRAGMFVGQFHCNALHADWWREQAKSGGQIVEQLIHIVDLARHQLGEPQSVYARGSNFFHRTVDRYDSLDASAMLLGYDDGSVAVLNATNGAIPGKWEKNWQVIAQDMTGQFTGWNSGILTRTGVNPGVEKIDTQKDVFVAQLEDIAAAISQRRVPRVPLEEGAKTLRTVLAAAPSVREM